MDITQMPLSIVAKELLRESDDSLPSTSISLYRDQSPPPINTKKIPNTLSLNSLPSLSSNSNNNFTIGGSFLTKSHSLHSSSSSVYSSPEPNNKQKSTTRIATNSDISARSSVISHSQESAKSIVSSVGGTSVSEESHYSQEFAYAQKTKAKTKSTKRRSEAIKQVLSFSSLQRRKSAEKNPFKWLSRRSDTSIRQSTSQLKIEQQMEVDHQSNESEMQPPKTSSSDLGPAIVQKIERLEDKLDTFLSGLANTHSPSFDAESKRINSEPRHNTYMYDTHVEETHLKILIAEIANLTTSNNKLSLCIDALGSSGLLDLLEMLSCSLERLHAAITSLREEQKPEQQQTNPEKKGGKQLESQMEIIQRLGFLLGQREEQLRYERNLNQSYRKNIEGLEEMIRLLEEEWERAVPVMTSSDTCTLRIQRMRGILSSGNSGKESGRTEA